MPKRLLQYGFALSRSPFARSVGSLMVLTAIGQGLYIAAAPLLGRLYTPEAFGLYALFYLFVTTSTIFICLNYDMAIPAAVDEADANDLAEAAIRLSVVVCAAAGALLTGAIALDLVGFGALPWWAGPMASSVLLFQALIQIFQAWYVRAQTAVTIGQAGVTLNAVRGGVQVGLGALGGAWWGLALGEVLGRVAALIHSVSARGAWKPRPGFAKARMPWSTLRRYRQFPLVFLSSNAVEALVMFAQIATLSTLFGPAGMGQYFMMRRTVDLPVAFAFRSLSDIFYGRLSDHCRNAPEQVRPFYLRSFLILAAIGYIGALPLMAFAEPIFEVVLGPAWGEAGRLAAVMAPSAVLNLAVAPAARIFGLSRRPWLRSVYTITNALSVALVLILASTQKWSLFTTTVGLSAATCFVYVAYFVAGFFAASSLLSSDSDGDKPPNQIDQF